MEIYKNKGNLREEKFWYSDKVRNVCTSNYWYTMGNCREYEEMLEYVNDNKHPNIDNLLTVAYDIYFHTDTTELFGTSTEEEVICHIMTILNRDAVLTVFTS